MATIKLKGDTSGEISLTTPATLSNGTLTIPDTTGTITTENASGDVSVTNDLTVGNDVTATGAISGASVTATGNISTPTGTVTASSFSGDGSSLTGIAGGFSNMEVFTSPGTWTNPGSVQKVKVTVVGGGGGGAGHPNTGSQFCPGGAGGGTVIEVIPFPSATNVPVTVGGGGAGGNFGGGTGGTGGTSSFGSYCSATGGGGTIATSSNPAWQREGGVGSGGNINLRGQGSGGSQGGSSAIGGGGATGMSGSTPINTQRSGTPGNYGGGGGGAGPFDGIPSRLPFCNGGAGGDGVVIVEY